MIDYSTRDNLTIFIICVRFCYREKFTPRRTGKINNRNFMFEKREKKLAKFLIESCLRLISFGLLLCKLN